MLQMRAHGNFLTSTSDEGDEASRSEILSSSLQSTRRFAERKEGRWKLSVSAQASCLLSGFRCSQTAGGGVKETRHAESRSPHLDVLVGFAEG